MPSEAGMLLQTAFCYINQPDYMPNSTLTSPPIKQAGDRTQCQHDSRRIDCVDFFLKEQCARKRTQNNHADIHTGKNQGRIILHHLVRGDVGYDIHKIQTAQEYAADHTLNTPSDRFGKQAGKHQHTRQHKCNQQVARKCRSAFGKLFEQDIDNAVTCPHAQQQCRLPPRAS